MELLFALAVIIAVVFYFKGRKKTKAEAWVGTVTDKQERSITHSDGDDTQWLEVTLKLEDGQLKTIEVKENLYQQVKVGDKLQKASGQMHPTKV